MSLARLIADGRLDLDELPKLDDDAVTRELVQVKGVGEWTATVFLIFALHRPDVLARGDLGIRKAARQVYHLAALPDPGTLTTMAEPWRPYRTRACFYLWQVL